MNSHRRPIRTARAQRNLQFATLAGLAVARALVLGEPAVAAPPVALPVPCAAGTCAANSTPGFSAPSGFVTYGKASATQSGNSLTVQQSSNQAILNWSSFNIGAGGTVTFQQPSSTAIALNKIYQNSPSSIFGSLSANGQVYLINPNGFVFGSGSTVNVAGLVASSLGLTGGDSEITASGSGLATQVTQSTPASALSSDGRIYVTDASGNLVLDANGKPQPVQISVQAGAQISAGSKGLVLLAGQTVTNAGTVTAPSGQVALAAGQTIYLAGSTDPALRGLLVEVTNNGTTATNLGTVTNQAGGTLSSPLGNVTLAGLAVNQSGRISATTSVSYNGSVVLQAGQGGASHDAAGTSCAGNEVVCTTQGGQLTLGATSAIDVLPDYSDPSTAAVAQTQIQSSVQLTGQQVFIQGGEITAPGGNLNVLAATNPDQGLQAGYDPGAELRVAAGTNINLAGSDATVPMSSNLVSIQLNSNELEDDPSQRTGPLKGQTVIVDVRNGKPAIVSESSWQSTLQGLQENVAQRTSVGGTASFQSVGDVVVSPGVTVNVSGGVWNYTGGVAQTSELLGANGKSYEVSSANPNLTYTGVINPTYTTTYNGFGVQITSPTPGLAHYDPGYTQGFSAGSVTFAAPAMSLQGTLVGTAVNGVNQRTAAPAESLIGYLAANGGNGADGNGGIAQGGTLIIGDSAAFGAGASTVDSYPNLFAPAITFSNSASPLLIAAGTPLPPETLQLTTSYITSGGFSQTHIFSDSTVTLPAGMPLNLGAGGDLQITAPRIDINSNITALDGTIALESIDTAVHQINGAPRLGIDIGADVTLDVSGQWTNDLPYASGTDTGPTYQNGGTISLTLATPSGVSEPGGELVLGNGVSLDANGGAWLQSNGTVSGGTGGNITLGAGTYESALQVGNNVGLSAFGVQGAAGGSFSLSAPALELSQGNGSWAGAQTVDWLPPPSTGTQAGSASTGTSQSNSAPTVVPMFDIGAALFSRYGFSSVSLTATDPIAYGGMSTDLLTITPGTSIDAQSQSLQLLSSALTQHSGGTVQGFTSLELLPEAYRNPSNISLSVAPVSDGPPTTVWSYGNLDMQVGSSISADSGAGVSSITLASLGSILIDGTLRAPGGTIAATIGVPNAQNDYGFLASQVLELGSTGVLDVSGAVVLTPNELNLALGNVEPGGTVTLTANRGDVVTDAGSLINIAGGSALLDVQNLSGTGGYTAAVMGSAGGTLSVGSGESISLLGTLRAAPGASSSGNLEGGTLNVSISASDVNSSLSHAQVGYQDFPSLEPTIELVSSTAGSGAVASYGEAAILGIGQLEQSGIDALTLQAKGTAADGTGNGTIAIDTNTPLSMAREINLDAPNIAVAYGTVATLNAPYVSFTDSNTAVAAPLTAVGGTGSLNVNAAQVVLSGYTALQGVSNATFTSSGDVELEPLNTTLSGSLSLAGNLTLEASRVYPATYASFSIDDPTGNVAIGQTSVSPGTPLSAGGSLTINAANITSGGTILAPFGSITLNASNTLELLSGSVTSVSAEGATIPYGETILNQGEWQIGPANHTSGLSGTPLGTVTLNAPSVKFDSNATVDLSGGGNLSAYEFTPGTGGSADVLNQTAGLYAIVPSLAGAAYAAYDVQAWGATSAAPAVGESVYLSGIGNLPAGVYTLLPATYALSMPGAYLVRAVSGFNTLSSGTIGHLTNGTPVVSGYLTFGNTGLQSSSGYQGFAIYPGSYGETLGEYDVSLASSYFASAAATAAAAGKAPIGLPADAGTLLIEAGTGLAALGNVNSTAGSGGTAATIEISASDLTITAKPTDTVASGVGISAPVLQSWNAGDLVLGGQIATDATTGNAVLDVVANSVTFASGAQLSANQVIAVANNTIDVQSGAIVASTSGMSGVAPKALPGAATFEMSGVNPLGVAMLSVSDSNLVLAGAYTANASSGAGSGSSSSSAPTPVGPSINIESGGALDTRGAVSLAAPTGITINGSVNGPGASWSLASNSISFVPAAGAPAGAPVDTLQISQPLLAQMQAAGAVQLTSATSIDLLTDVALGASSATSAPSLSALTLTASSINNCADCNSVFGAQTLTLAGTGATVAPTAGTGALTLVADTLSLGGAEGSTSTTGDLAVNGNSQTTVQVSGAIVGQGTNTTALSTVAFSGNVSVAAAELTAASDTGTAISVPNGTLTIAQNGTAASAASLSSSLGGQLAITADSITDSGSIVIPGGTASLAAPGDLALGSGALINTSGITVSVGDQTEGAAGGNVTLSAGGNLTLANGSTINVSGAGASPAGSLTLVGVGNVTADASFLGNAASEAAGGSFSLEAGSLVGGLSPALVSNLMSGGFNNQLAIESHTGDLDLASGQALTANNIILTADTGAVNVAGSLTATAASQSGSIGLYGGTGVSLLSGATLTANGIGSSGHGGQIEMSSTCATCTVTLESGSTIATNGGADGGELIIEAPFRGNDVAINVGGQGLGANVSGVGQVIIEPVQVFSETNATIATDLGADVATVAGNLGSALAGITSRLNPGSNATVQGGVEIDDALDETLTLPGLNLTQYSSPYSNATAEVIDLTVRAAGSLTIGGSITDGYDASNGLYTAGADSASLRFVAGADLTSANPLSTAFVPPGGSGATLNIGTPAGQGKKASAALVSTGTGNIDLASSGNVNFVAGSSAYTTGDLGAPTLDLSSPSNYLVDFPTGGGNVVVKAGQDVTGVLPSDDASVSAWEIRTTTNNGLTGEWGISLSNFAAHPWDVATLGGGDVSVSAGRDVTQVTAGAADSLLSSADGTTQTLLPGGGLVVTAGRDVTTGEFFVADGMGTVSAGRSFATTNIVGSTANTLDAIGSLFYMQNAQVSIWAQDDITLAGVVDPTQIATPKLNTYFWNYGAGATFSAQSAGGDITVNGINSDTAATNYLLGPTIGKATTASVQKSRLVDTPPSLQLVSLTGNLNLAGGGLTLYPSATGQLDLFAGKDITGTVTMTDSPASALSTVTSVQVGVGSILSGATQQYNFDADLHADDPNPAIVVAGQDIDNMTLSIPKAADIEAGRDIVNLTYEGQNLNANDVTLISAGRDITDPTTFDGSGNPQLPTAIVQVGGPGSLVMLAGRNIDLGFAAGVTTVGDLKNGNLPTAQGASITMAAGLGDSVDNPNYSAFYQQIIAPSAAYQQQLVSYVQSITGQAGLSTAQADTEFNAFSAVQQQGLIDSVFFNELNLSGTAANKGGGFAEGYAAIDALFPGSRSGAPGTAGNPYSGDIDLSYSQIYTESGGGISLLAPGGSINVGLAVPPTVINAKQPSQLGIVAEGSGDVNIYSEGDVNVDSSRIFTLGGGNILIWSDEGNIDAGKGSKTSLSAPPPTYSINAQGNVVTTFGAAVAGSGIRTIQTNPSEAAGNVNLIAPAGFVNAGEAGIGAAGSVNIAALAVLNAANISYGGTATGVPPLVSGITASLASAASAASATQSVSASSLDQSAANQAAAPLSQTAIGWLDVFVSGLGEENCKPEDTECLKRQKQE